MVVKMVVRPIAKLSEEARASSDYSQSFDVVTNGFRPFLAADVCRDAVPRRCMEQTGYWDGPTEG